jgi:transcriptional regulator with XRE-family HTH domain
MFNKMKVTQARGTMTQAELTRKMSAILKNNKHLTVQTISLWERGRRVPGTNNLWALSKVTNRSLDYFFGR